MSQLFSGSSLNPFAASPEAPSSPSSGFGAALDSVRRGVVGASQTNSGLAVLVVVATLTFAAVLGYVLYTYLVTNLKTTVVLEGAINASSKKTLPSKDLPTFNGSEFGFSMWIYLEALDNTAEVKDLFSIGDTTSAAGTTSMTHGVYLHPSTNSLVVALKTSESETDVGSLYSHVGTVMTAKAGEQDVKGWMIVPVDYVPMNKWINLTVVVDRQTVTVYVDGDMYSVSTTATVLGKNATISVPNDQVVAGHRTSNGAAVSDGMVSKVNLYNYAISIFHARVVYRRGPGSTGLLSLMGITNVKLQSPIVSLDSK
jgi:hypothetical protein